MSDNAQKRKFHAGDARLLDFTIYDEDPLDPGQPDLTAPVDLSAVTVIRFAIADAVTKAAHFTKTLIAGIVVTGVNNNIVRVTLANGDTKDLTPGRLYYELEVVEANGDNWTGPHGEFRLHASLLR